MRTAKFLLIMMAAIMIVTSCDWVRSQLGMATSDQIAELKREQQRVEAERRTADSIERVKQDSLSAIVADSVAAAKQIADGSLSRSANLSNRYHVVVGSFKDYSNSERMVINLKKRGYEPSVIDFKNGFKVVSVSSYSNMSAAFNVMYKLLDENFGADDIWVYDVRQALHK
ncbi:MAG: SPOR domain-containing protein [Bacteroidales bacterium]|jgi:hypothetical protein|nr:SPOR domain-containing protein [Bacteroidales bacterium]